MTSVAPFAATALALVVLGAAACSSSYSTDSGGAADAAPGDGSVFTIPDAGDMDATSDDAGLLQVDAAVADAGPCNLQQPGLVAYYPFDDNTGARDCSGNGHDGVVTNGGFGNGKIGGALQLKGNGCVDLGADASFVQNGDFTVALWVNIAMTTGTAEYLVGKANGAPTNHGWRVAWEAQNPTVSFKIGTPAGAVAPASGNQPLGTWMHVAAVFAASSRTEVWINGVLSGSAGAPPSAILDDPTARFRIGCGESNDYVVGSIDEVRMYNRALSAPEIAALAK